MFLQKHIAIMNVQWVMVIPLCVHCQDVEADCLDVLTIFSTQKKPVFKNKRKNASYVSIMFLKPPSLCFSNPRCSVFDYFQCFIQTHKTPD